VFEEVVHGKLAFMLAVKGEGNTSFNRLALKFNELTTRESLRFPIVTKISTARSATDALWVVESDDSTGTAFWLEDVGLVTCAHVLGDIITGRVYGNLRVFRHDKDNVPYRLTMIHWDPARDLAICATEVDWPDMPGGPLSVSTRTVQAGLQATLMGFPNYNAGHEPYIVQTTVARRVPHMGRAMLEVSEQIRPGLSGGPIVDSRGHALAVISTRVSAANDDGTLAGGNYAILLEEIWDMQRVGFGEGCKVGRATLYAPRDAADS
jgi:S1-C subfamily serine protease